MEFLIPVALLALLVLGYLAVHRAISRNVMARHGGDFESAASDHTEPIPSTPDITDDIRPLGDTPEAHDEISPRDLPRHHPARPEAERLSRDTGVTSGNR